MTLPRITDIRIERSPIGDELRLDWSNDWHLAIVITDHGPDGIAHALIDAAQMIRKMPTHLPVIAPSEGD
jgi:hypothetical protein